MVSRMAVVESRLERHEREIAALADVPVTLQAVRGDIERCREDIRAMRDDKIGNRGLYLSITVALMAAMGSIVAALITAGAHP
jgi:hypothetical protein